MKILLTVSYDGTNYHGWQRQINGDSVQEKLELALSEIFGCKTAVTGASRTDAGVHALGQKASFFADSCVIPLEKLPIVINNRLPDDIAVTAACEVETDFHARFDAKRKQYKYDILNNRYPVPQLRNYACHIPYALDLFDMREAAAHLVGEHDFAAFCATGGSAKSTVRKVYGLEIDRAGDLITIQICGNGFLYNMVRIIAGTLIYVGCKKITPSAVEGILRSRDRTQAGKTAPPHGLTLVEVYY